jgi:hypothetical protein
MENTRQFGTISPHKAARDTAAPGATASERQWIALFAASFGGFWLSAPTAGATLMTAGVLSLAVMAFAIGRVALMERNREKSGEPQFAERALAGVLMAALLWLSLLAAHAVAPADGGFGMTLANSICAVTAFAVLVVLENVFSYLALRVIGAGKSVLAAELVMMQAIETKFGGVAGRVAR